MNRFRFSRIPLLTGIALALVCAACGKKQEQQQAPPPPEVGVITAQSKTVPLTRDLVGRLQAFRSSDVRARVPGVLVKRVYTEGSDVKEGQLLFEIDPAPLQATLNASSAALAQAQATATNNRIAAQRARELVPKGFVSKSDVDNAEAAERTAAAAVKQAQANVESAKINLGYASVRAPISGRSGKQQVTEGALVGQGEATLLTTIDQIDPVYVNFTIGVNDLDEMRQANKAGKATLSDPDKAEIRLTLPDGSEYGDSGTLDFSATTVDPATGAVSLRGQMPNKDHSLLPGMYVTIKVTLGQQHDVFEIPQPALQRDATSAYVYVIGGDGKVARKDVSADVARAGNWIISGGLANGDQVIASGLQRVKTGQPAKGSPWQPGKPDSEQPGNAPPKAPGDGKDAQKAGANAPPSAPKPAAKTTDANKPDAKTSGAEGGGSNPPEQH